MKAVESQWREKWLGIKKTGFDWLSPHFHFMACGGSCRLLKSTWDIIQRLIFYWDCFGMSIAFFLSFTWKYISISLQTYMPVTLFCHYEFFTTAELGAYWAACHHQLIYSLLSSHRLPDCEKLSMPEVSQKTLQELKMATSNHCQSRQPFFSFFFFLF